MLRYLGKFIADAVRPLSGSGSTSAHMLYTCDPFRVGRIIRAFLYTYDSFSFTRIFLGLILKGS
ncbi:hypothetical protein, partial [Anditalea andensis]|uniref:hypothetical protein n=1 Tax=Anditalea andensis TaxID=1048983 RepID=UPI001969C6E4